MALYIQYIYIYMTINIRLLFPVQTADNSEHSNVGIQSYNRKTQKDQRFVFSKITQVQ